RSRRNPAGDGPAQNLPAHSPCEATTGECSSDSSTAASETTIRSGCNCSARRLYERGEVYVVQRADEGGCVGIATNVCHSRPDAEVGRPARAQESAVVRHGGFHSKLAAHPGVGIPRDAGGSAASVPGVAGIRCEQSLIRGTGCPGGTGAERTGGGPKA